jgi:hypothetical protein
MTNPTPHRRQTPWQFSVASLLALMTFVAVGLALFRPYPNLSIALFVVAGLIAALLTADYFAGRANRQNWRTLTQIMWLIVIAILFVIAMAVVYTVGQTAGVF